MWQTPTTTLAFYSQPSISVSASFTCMGSTNLTLEIFGEKSPKISEKAKVEIATLWQLFTQHLHCIYSVYIVFMTIYIAFILY